MFQIESVHGERRALEIVVLLDAKAIVFLSESLALSEN
jgi:hypothetical protein